jgi:hypothetical protein
MIAHVAFGAKSPIDLTGNQPVGTLVLDSIEGSSGEVYVDEIRVGHLETNSQLVIASLTVGPHRYRVTGPLVNSSADFVVKASEATRFSVRPEPPSNLTVTVH